MYKWDIDEVEKTIADYLVLQGAEEDSQKKDMLQDTIYCFEELVDYYNMTLAGKGRKVVSSYYSITKGADYREIVISDLSILRDYGLYCPIVRDFTSQFIVSGPTNAIKLNTLITSERDIVQLNDTFYKQFSGDIREAYKELASNFKTRLQFLKINNKYNFSGYTHPIIGTNRAYIDVGLVNSLQDYVSLMHESGHGVSSILNQDIMWDCQKYGFSEVDGLFFEMIGTDYSGEKLHQEEEANKIKLEIFNDYLYFAEILCSKMDMYTDLSGEDLKDKRKVKKYLKDIAGYNKLGVKDACTTSIREYIHYIVSYLTAIELYMIYQVDRDTALNLLYKIIMLKDLTTSGYVEKIKELGITPGENVKKYYEMIAPRNGGIYLGKKI